MIKVGSQVYIVPEDTRTEPYYVTVKSIGSKYITVGPCHPSYSRFSIYTHESVNDKTGWNPRLTLYESKAAYDDMRELQRRKNRLLSKIENLIQTAPIEKLESIYNILT